MREIKQEHISRLNFIFLKQILKERCLELYVVMIVSVGGGWEFEGTEAVGDR